MNFLLRISPNITEQSNITSFAQYLAQSMGKQLQFGDTTDDDTDLLFIACPNRKQTIQRYLNEYRDLRIPYLFLTDTMQMPEQISDILLPVSMLQEEVHKAQFAAHISRYTGASVQLLTAKDYGSAATQNTNKMATLFEKMDVKYTRSVGSKDSFSLYKEIPYCKCDLTVLTASREYGLDDLLFGPPERYIICRSKTPVMLLNPREDLFSLCD